ncbi:MAG: hypothetical protein ACTSXV_00850 [Alphaproteobacteria bacterium]
MTHLFKPTSAQIGTTDRLNFVEKILEAKKMTLGIIQESTNRPFLQAEDMVATASLLRGLFGFEPSIRFFQNETKAVSGLFEIPNLIIAISTQVPPEGWWLKLTLDKKNTPQIFGKVTAPSTPEHSVETYLLAEINEDIIWETTLIVLETGQAVSKQWIEKSLLKLGLPIKSVFDTLATHTGKCLHVVEVSRSMKRNDPALSISTDVEGIYVRVLKKIGGYNS